MEYKSDTDYFQESSTWEKLTLLLCQGFWNTLSYCISKEQNVPFTKVDVTLVGERFAKVFSYNNGIEVNSYDVDPSLNAHFVYSPNDELLENYIDTGTFTLSSRTLSQKVNRLFRNWEKDTEDEYPRDVLASTEYLGKYDCYSVFVTLIGYSFHWQSKEMVQHLFHSYIRKWKTSKLSEINEVKAARDWSEVIEYIDYRIVVRDACDKALMQYLNVDDADNDNAPTPFVFDILCEIASLPYEGGMNRGSISVLSTKSSDSLLIAFKEPINFLSAKPREIRKLLEMTDEHQSIILTNGNIVGIGKQQNKTITFKGNGQWSLQTHRGIVLSVEANRAYVLPSAKSSGFDKVFSQTFKKDPGLAINAVVNAAQNQKHGTSIVITANALEEAKRLSSLNRGIQVRPSNVSNELMLAITSIDGAIMIDENGQCYAIGVILDGEAVLKGDKGRGARFNSLCNYVEWRRTSMNEDCMAVIVSEDRTVDVYPSVKRFPYLVSQMFDEEGNG